MSPIRPINGSSMSLDNSMSSESTFDKFTDISNIPVTENNLLAYCKHSWNIPNTNKENEEDNTPSESSENIKQIAKTHKRNLNPGKTNAAKKQKTVANKLNKNKSKSKFYQLCYRFHSEKLL